MDAQVAREQPQPEFEAELRLLLESIYARHQYDFRGYATPSLKRRLRAALLRFRCATLAQLQERLECEPELFPLLLDFLTVHVSDMFRDPEYYRALREQVAPVLRTWPSLRVWVAGCSTGEEAYSLAILLDETGLLERSLIYATDINPRALQQAADGVYDIRRVAGWTENHRRSGAPVSLSEYYLAGYGAALFDKRLRKHIVFSDHSLATDSVFAEVQLVSCRNVLIYFDRTLQERAIGLFRDALCRNGFLGLGAKESLRFSRHAAAFAPVCAEERIFQRRGLE